MYKLHKQSSHLLIIGIIVLLISSCFDVGVGNGYVYNGVQLNNVYISKNNKNAVNPTIVDHVIVDKYVVGLRLPAENFTCVNETTVAIMISDNRLYFVLDTSNGVVMEYNSQNEFIDKLVELNINKKVLLNYSKFDIVWKHYSKQYETSELYSACKPYIKMK